VLLMDGQLDVHFVGKLEQTFEKSRFVRVDSDVVDNLIVKTEKEAVKLTEEQQESLKKQFNEKLPVVEKVSFTVQLEHLGENASPVVLTINEFMRRMQEMAAMNPGMNFYGDMPLNYTMVVNIDHVLVKSILENEQAENKEDTIKQLMDLALLSNGLLKGEALTNFVKRSYGMIQ
jgi:molecular chaperone HtpG